MGEVNNLMKQAENDQTAQLLHKTETLEQDVKNF